MCRRLVWVNHYAVSPDLPGGTRHFELGRELVRLGWDVTVVCTDFHFQERRYCRRQGSDRSEILEVIDGVRFSWLWSAAYQSNNWRRAANWLSFARRVASLRHEADLVIGSSPHLFAADAARQLARRRRVPFVLEVRDLWPESLTAAGGRKGLAYHVLDRLARSLYRAADGVIVLTPGVQRTLEKRRIGSKPLVLAPNGVDIDAFPLPDRQAGPQVTFIYAGAHGPANGLDTLLDAANLLRDDDRIRILAVGDGPDKDRLVGRAAELRLTNLEFRPSVPKARVPDVLQGADVGLMLLRDTALFAFGVSPNKLFDYFAAALPVLSNVAGETADMVAQARGGLTVAPGSAQELARGMQRMAGLTLEERQVCGLQGRRWVETTHGRSTVARRLHDEMVSLIAGRTG